MEGDESELVFCDTFKHDGEENQLHLDLVRFTPPVLIREVRVVPRDQRVHNELEIAGQTIPSSFTLDVFVNDSTNPLAPTFDPVGTLDFQAEVEALLIKPKTSSDLVVVRGYYSVLTLCIYGNVVPPPSQSPFRSPRSMSPRSRSGSPYSDSRSGSGSGYSDDDRSPSPEPGSEVKEDGKKSEQFDLFEPFSPVNSPDHLFDLSDEELGTKRSTTTPGGYVVEEFSDEEITFDNDEFDMQEGDTYLYSEDAWITSSASFNPYQCEFVKLETYSSLTETPHEVLLDKLQKMEASTKRGSADEASKLRDVVLKPKDISQPQKLVDTLEEIPSFLYPGLAQLQKKSSSDAKDVMQKLGSWTLQCLNLEKAREIPAGLNIRQLKAGMRIVPGIAALGRKCAHALIKHGILEKLCKLVVADHMASSLKLLSLRAVDKLLNYPQGIERFLGWTEKNSSEDQSTPYQQILDLLLKDPPVRVCKSASALLRKAHIYELLATLQHEVDKVVASTPVKSTPANTDEVWNTEDGGEKEKDEGTEDEDLCFSQPKEKRSKRPQDKSGSFGPEDQEMESTKQTEQLDEAMEGVESQEKPPPIQLPMEMVERICQCLEELKRCLEDAVHTIVQPPLKSFPTSVKYFPEEEESDSFAALVRMFQSRRLLNSLVLLLTAPSTAMEIGIFAASRNLVIYFLNSQEGLKYLLSDPPVMNTLTRALTQNVENEPLNAMLPLTDFLSADNSDSCSAQNLGLLLIYHLQVLQSLDALRKAPRQTMADLESTECIGALHVLYSMTLTPVGKCAVSHILSKSDNITAILPFVEPRKQRDHDDKLSKSSVSSRYGAVLLLQLFQSSARGDFLVSYSSRLLSMAEFFKDNSSPTMSDLFNWVYPLKDLTPGDSSKNIPILVGVIKEHIPFLSCNKPGKGSSPVLTSLRLLLDCVTPPDSMKGRQKDMKYTQAIITLFSSNAMDTLITFFTKFSEVVLPVWCQRQSLSITHARILVSLVTFALRLTKVLLSALLSDGDYQYRDTRVASVLLDVHKVMCSAPYSTIISNSAPDIQSHIIDVLVMYTKPDVVLQDNEEKPDARTSGWCLMLQVLFKYTQASPHCFLSGLMILSELLPLPLPVQSPRSVSEVDWRLTLNLRQLWAVHLEPFLFEITELIQSFIGGSSTTLQQALRRVCAQLADLSPSLAAITARLIIRAVLSEIERQLEQPDIEEEPTAKMETGQSAEGGGTSEGVEGGGEKTDELPPKKCPNSSLLRVLASCAILIQQPAFKIAALQLLQQRETDETIGFSRFVPLLLFLMQKKESTVQAKLCVMSILNALCNVYVALNTSEVDPSQLSSQQLSDCLPGFSQLEHITSAVLGHIASPDRPLATVLLGLKVILSICQFNAGLLCFYGLLSTNINRLALLLERLVEAVKSSPTSSDATLSCISLFLELLRLLISSTVTGRLELTASSVGGDAEHKRYEMKTVDFPRDLIKTITIREGGVELLVQLRDALQESCKEEESILGEFFTLVTELLQEFDGITPNQSDLYPLEPDVWPDMQSLESQFRLRNIFNVSDNAATSSPEYWLASPPHDESELEPETVTKDLAKLASESCGGLNLEEELKKHLLPSPPRTPPKLERKRKIALSGPEAQKRLKDAMEQRLKFGNRDLFRSRKQNTSRPPSMHVDDFMAKNSPRSMSRGGHHMGSGPDRGHLPYMPPQPGMFVPPMGGRHWMGPVPPGVGYQRRDMGLGMRPWDSRLPQSFMPAMKPIMRSAPPLGWPGLPPYGSRGREGGGSASRGGMMWPSVGRPLPPSSSRMSRHSIYKRLV